MNTEQLKELGLNDNQIQEVFKLRGQEIEQANANKQALEAQQAENENLKNQIKEANKQISDFKELDIDSIKQRASEYETKYQESESKRKQELEDLNLQHSIDLGLIKAGTKNSKATKALLDYDALRASKNLENDINSQIESLKESDSYLFKGTEESQQPSMAKGNAIDTNKDVSEMTYAEMLEANKKGLL